MTGPALFNACEYLLDRHIREGRGDRLALTGVPGPGYDLRVLGEDGLEAS